MALRWAAAAHAGSHEGLPSIESATCICRPLRAALAKQGQQPTSDELLVQIAEAAVKFSMRNDRFDNFNSERDIPARSGTDWPGNELASRRVCAVRIRQFRDCWAAIGQRRARAELVELLTSQDDEEVPDS
jgi:hypothetical protein